MNAPSRFAVKACLLAAVSGALFNQAIGLVAQDEVPSARDDSAAPRIRRTAGVQGGTSAASQSNASPGGTSEVQKQLQELYRKNGREMPSMNLEDLPNTAAPVPSASAPVQVAPNGPIVSPTQASVKPGKPNWFERTFHFGRGKRQPPAVAQPVRPGPGAAGAPQPQRFSVRPAPLATAPTYRAPVATPAPAQQPAVQQPLREPTPIGIPGGVSDLAARPAAPEARPTRRNGISPPLMDESETGEDSETLDLNQDDQPKFVHQAPQIRPNPTFNPAATRLPGQTPGRDSDSPYTGLTISPNEMEQKIAGTPKPAADAGAAAAPSATSEPAAVAPEEVGHAKIAKSAPSNPAAITPKTDPGMMDDEDDDEDDDDEPLTLPLNDSDKPARKSPEVGRVAEADKPAEPVDKPATEKPLAEKTASEKPAADKPAPEIEKPATPAPMKCFRGYCPVVLKDDRKLIEAKQDIKAEYHGRIYTFSSVEAKETFEDNPRKYIPAGDGIDVVRHAAGDSDIEGTLEHAAWYRGRLYLFSSAESRREFVDAPSKFLVND
jgi:YHS domain-containing protein